MNGKRGHLLGILFVIFTGGVISFVEADTTLGESPKRLACVGDSITEGAGTTDSYPKQLQRMLGNIWVVGNFGLSGTTLLNSGDSPYQQTETFKRALNFNPHVVVIMLGTNDSKPQNWKFKDQYIADYKNLIKKFKALPTKPKIFVCYPVLVVGDGNFGINEVGVKEAIKMIDQVAQEEQVGLIDLHSVWQNKESLIPDRVHPNNEGASWIARNLYKEIKGE